MAPEEVQHAAVFWRSSALRWTVASLLLFVVVEGLVFRLGWYNRCLEPDSTAGRVESYLYWLKRHPHGRKPEVLVMGDSRIAEGFSAPEAAKDAAGRIRFWNFGIPGATPRAWYYLLRDADPTRRRFAAIVIPFDEYADEDHTNAVDDDLMDLNYLVGRLRLTDCVDFASSMGSAGTKGRALSGCLFKGIALRRDVQEFLQHFRDRIRRARDFRENGLRYIDDYKGHQEDLRGLRVDFVRRTIYFPQGVTGMRRTTVQDWVLPEPVPQTGELTRYRKLWFGRILDLYRNSPTRIIFLELPRGPVHVPESRVPARFLQWARGRWSVTVLPPEMFRDLERPELYFDGLHLNSAGRPLFTAKLAEAISPLVGTR
ncbi:MAG TPA: hypothetical protein VHC72_21230 [Bryobacteraceae bacterium]|nr:hypothetical protein [Bryobacteraceae bacterium]